MQPWNWNFGDGTNSTEQNPVHTYSKAGNYTVNLDSKQCKQYEVNICFNKSNEKYTFVTKWGSNGSDDGQFQGPYGVAVILRAMFMLPKLR